MMAGEAGVVGAVCGGFCGSGEVAERDSSGTSNSSKRGRGLDGAGAPVWWESWQPLDQPR